MRLIGLTILASTLSVLSPSAADAQRQKSAGDVQGRVVYRGAYEQRATSGAVRHGDMEFDVIYQGATITGTYRSSSLGAGRLTGSRNGRQCNIDGGGAIGHYQCDRYNLVGSETVLQNGRAVAVISYRMSATQ